MLSTATNSLLRPMVRTAARRHNNARLDLSRGMTILSEKSAEEYKKQNYTDRMKKTGRPVSPHVTIYAFPIAALSSITVRVTGVALSFGAMGVGMLELFGGTGTSLSVFQDLGGAYGPLVAAGAKFSVAFPCVYHYLGAARHFAWDEKPELLTNIGVEKASYALYGASLFISGGLMIV